MNAVVLTFERLPARFLGCYGSEEAATPVFDRLAAESVVFDFHYCEYAVAYGAVHAWWTGRSLFPHPPEVQESFPPLVRALAEGGVRTMLLTEKGAGPSPPGFDEVIEVSGRDGLSAEVDETPFARLVAAAQEQLAALALSESRPWLLWLRSRGVEYPWVPPRCFLIDEMLHAGGPEAFDAMENDADEAVERSPRLSGNGNAAARESAFNGIAATLLKWLVAPVGMEVSRHAPEPFLEAAEEAHILYAAYVRLLDHELGRLRTAIEHACGEGPLLVAVTAALGQSLGETVLWGERPTERERGSHLVEEFTHTPLFIQLRPVPVPGRSRELVQTVDLGPTLLDWFGVPGRNLRLDGRSLLPIVRAESSPPREFICLGDDDGQRAIRTEDFLLITGEPPGSETPTPPRLYVQPDDRWQVNDVAAQSPEEVSRLERLLEEFVRSQAAEGER